MCHLYTIYIHYAIYICMYKNSLKNKEEEGAEQRGVLSWHHF